MTTLRQCASIVLQLSDLMTKKHHLDELEARQTIFDLLTRSSGTALYPLHRYKFLSFFKV